MARQSPSSKPSPVSRRLQQLADLIGGQTALAARVGMARGTIWEFVTGRREPPVPTLHIISAKYPCPLEWILEGKGAPPKADPKRTLEANNEVRARKQGLSQTSRYPHLSAPSKAVGTPSVRRWPEDILDERLFNAYGGGETPIDALQKILKRLVDAVGSASPGQVERVLGPALAAEVRVGRAVPAPELLLSLESTLGLEPGHFFGLGA